MPLALYMDHHVPRPITAGLRRHGVDVLTALEDGTRTMDDPDLLDRATSLGRCVYTEDEDFLAEGKRRLVEGVHFAGIIYTHQLRLTVGQRIAELLLLCELMEPEEMVNRIIFLPFKD